MGDYRSSGGCQPEAVSSPPRFATVYYWALGIVFLSATGMALLRSSEDRNLFVLGTISFGVGSIGYAARRIRWRGSSFHILDMSLSYIVLLTAFYVDDDPHLPLWDRLPALAYWTLPALVGVTLVTRAVRRHTHLTSDLFAARQSLRSGIGGSL